MLDSALQRLRVFKFYVQRTQKRTLTKMSLIANQNRARTDKASSELGSDVIISKSLIANQNRAGTGWASSVIGL
ncbi:hypothetical protein RRG08_006141 [Elysia crispata]|uniref:Uncharacterized protein n=1 Tax=Elysia crispata TaxID=231223 RepID=A0AAE1E1L2_9GAST|nr:hypothetical protein RRG08_006141 [Elysia crispata]